MADYDRMAIPVSGDAEQDAKVAAQGLKRVTLYPDTRLYFAGEATHRADAYTVHGAFLSGVGPDHLTCSPRHHGGHGEMLVPPYTRGRFPLSLATSSDTV
jgi:hypothetical protein